MSGFRIPEKHARGLSRIIGFSSDESSRVEQALSKAKSINIKELTDLVVAAIPLLTRDDAKEIVDALVSLFSVRIGIDLTIDSFVAALMEAAQQAAGDTGNSIQAQPPEVVMTTLKNLLSVRPLSMIAKARSLHTDHENTFCNARILTDLRAVFDADVKESPAGFVMAHILKLGYHHAGKHTELHLALDKVDVDNLINALERAKLKATTLSTVTGQSGFSILAE